MPKARALDEFLEAGQNSFNLVRLLAALCVLVSHSFLIVGGMQAVQPLGQWTPFTLGQHAVNVFFTLSGLMLARSLARNGDIPRFLWARFLRVFPGLFVYGVIFAFVVGPLFTSLPLARYLTDWHTISYPIAVLVRFNGALPPHGIFDLTPLGPEVNLPLWTVRYELLAYAMLASAFAVGLLRTKLQAIACLAALVLIFLAVEHLVVEPLPEHALFHHLAQYGLCFMLGVTAYHFRARLRLSAWGVLAALGCVLLMRGTPFEELAYLAMTAYAALVFGSLRFGRLTAWTQRNDVSYGTYIYGWPVQQALVTLVPTLTAAKLALLTMMIVPAIGLVSWRLIEHPCIRLQLLAQGVRYRVRT